MRAEPQPTNYVLQVRDDIAAQAAFWRDESRVRGFVGGLGSGKSFAGCVEVFRMPPNTTGLVVSPTYPMLRDTTQRTFFEICPPSLITYHNKTENRTELADGKTILWRSADKPDSLRGPNINWAWGDEWAFVSEETHRVVMGRLRRRPGRFWFSTTPQGQNWLYKWCVLRDLGYSIHQAHTADNPHNIASYAEDLAKEYADDPLFAAQELAGQWVDTSGSKRFSGTMVEAVFKKRERLNLPELPAIIGTDRVTESTRAYTLPSSVRLYEEPQEGLTYRLGLDCAEGVRGGDDSTIVVVEKVTGRVVCVGAGEWEPTEEHPAYAAILSRWYNDAPALPERNNHGHAVIGALDRFGVEVLLGADHKPGWRTDAASKAQLFNCAAASLKVAQGEGEHIFPDERLKEQVKGIDRVTLKGPGKGRITKVDDECIAWALADQARLEDDGIIIV